jgi:PAS domain S-box-containing protein
VDNEWNSSRNSQFKSIEQRMENTALKDYPISKFFTSTPLAISTVALLYVLLAKESLFFRISPGNVTPIYPSIGLGLAAVLILGYRVLPGVWLGSFSINLLTFYNISHIGDYTLLDDLLSATVIGIGNVVGIGLAVYFIKRLWKDECPLYGGRNVMILLFVGAFVCCIINSVIGIFALSFVNAFSWEQLKYIWLTWWLGDSIGLITVAPLILAWLYKDTSKETARSWWELTGLIIGALSLCYFIYYFSPSYIYLLFPLLLISAYYFGMRGTTAVILVIAVFSVINTDPNIAPFAAKTVNDSILLLDVFITVVTISSLGFAGIVADHNRTEEALKINEQKYRSIFENMQDVFYQTDLNGIIVEVSPYVENLIKLPREKVIGCSVYDYYANIEDRDELINILLKKGEVRDHELSFKSAEGDSFYVSINARLIRDDNGIPIHIDGVLRNNTERKNNELKILAQNKELEQFAYIASHDLQEPLITLKGFSELLKDEIKGKISEDANQYLSFIMESSERMQELIKGLLFYSKIGKERSFLTVDCNEILQEVIQDMDAAIRKDKAQINVKPLPKINGNAFEIRQLFQNLISNSLKFQKKNTIPKINISVKELESNWVFSVEDNGIGIDKKDMDKVFIIFKRLHNRADYDGTGIGLSHCKKIVELHGGNIWIESTVGEGSIFKFTIPKMQ